MHIPSSIQSGEAENVGVTIQISMIRHVQLDLQLLQVLMYLELRVHLNFPSVPGMLSVEVIRPSRYVLNSSKIYFFMPEE